jgi:hypothetical protein
MKWRFAGLFLLAFAFWLTLWWAIDFAQVFRTAVLATARAVSPVVSGWWLEFTPGDAVFRTHGRRLHLLLSFPQLSMGVVPLLSLIVATPGIGLRRGAASALLGVLLYFLIDVMIVLSYPLIMDEPNAVKDTLGVFSGLVAFVVAPLALWFVLTYRTLRPLWQLTLPATPPVGGALPTASRGSGRRRGR